MAVRSNTITTILSAPVPRQGAPRAGHGGHSIAGRADNARIAEARVSLKIAALACAGSRYDPQGGDLLVEGVRAVVEAAGSYYRELRRGSPGTELDRGGLRPGDEVRVGRARDRLILSSLAYTAGRHGADACVEFTRAAIRNLCQSAICLGEAIDGAEDGSCRGDPTIHLDDGR